MTAGGGSTTHDMRSRVAGGLGWVGASQIAGQLIRTAGAIAVARLLAPEAYGLAMLALVFSSLVLVFSDLAIGAALVQRKSLSEADRSTAFWITIASGVLFTLIGVALSGPVASLYGQPEAQPLLAVLSLSFILTALGATQQSLLLRDMNFRRSETLNVAATLAGTVVAVIIAAAGGGAWAIIGQQLVIAASASVLLWFASSWRPHLIFSRESARFLANFSGYLVGHRLLYYLHQNADRFLIGRYIGTAALGAYAVAYNVMLAPSARIAGPIQRVLAPAFSRMQDEPERIAAAWARVTRLVGMIAIPGLVGVVVVAPDFVPVVLGDQWEAAVPVIQLLAWVGILQALQAVNVDILMARGRTKTMFRYMIVFCIAHVIAFIVGLNVSGTIVGIAAAYAISSTLVEPILTVLTARALGVSPWIFVKSVAGVAASAAVMAGVVLVARLAMVDAGVPATVRLALCTVLGAAVFGALCFWRVPEIRRDLRSLLGSRLPVPRTAAAES